MPTIASCVKKCFMQNQDSTFDIFLQQSLVAEQIRDIQDQLKNNAISVQQAKLLLDKLIDINNITPELNAKIIQEFDRQDNSTTYKNDTKRTVIIGNGDIQNILDIQDKSDEFEIDGGMIGRAVFHNPWVFDLDVAKNHEGQLYRISTGQMITIFQKLDLLREHLRLWQETWGDNKNYPVLKKYFKIYVSGFEGASGLRQKLMETKSPHQAEKILTEYLNT